MIRAIMQCWEESERGWGVRPDGCSVHLDMASRDSYVSLIYKDRNSDFVPDEYDRISGEPVVVYITSNLSSSMVNGLLRLTQCELGNLLKLEEIILESDYITYLAQNN